VTISPTRAGGAVAAGPIGPFGEHVSLMHGWVPLAAQILAAVLLALAIGRRTRRWLLLWLPVAVLAGVALAGAVRWSVESNGLSGEPAPLTLWIWVSLTGLAAGVAVLGWRSARWWRRGVSIVAVPMSALCAALMLNLWVGYFPTVQTAWGQLTGGPLPGQTDHDTVAKMLAAGTVPASGVVLAVTTPSEASAFRHRGELVYLPPAYFASNPPPVLPTVLMIGGQFNTPADWIRTAGAVNTIDEFAARHGGNAPVFVFADSGGSFNNDTECVNGVRGNAADHLTKDIVPYMVTNFGVSDRASDWGVVGWSSGGTCALNLTVKYPDLFSAFVDIDGDLYPNSGTKPQTIQRLYGGDAAAFDDWDPATLMTRHGFYDDVAGWFAVSEPPDDVTEAVSGRELRGRPPEDDPSGNPTAAARTLCGIAAAHGIDCAVVPQEGRHDWPFAARAFAASLPWLAARIGTPGAAEVPLPGAQTQAGAARIAPEAASAPAPPSRPAGVR